MSHLIWIYTVSPLVFEISLCYSLGLTFLKIYRRKFCRLLFVSESVKINMWILSYGTPEGTFLFQYLPEKKLKQEELEKKFKQ